tara:strand:+ start:585 stop:761 length:177 start_codon:yes stop_codon:yes gene_type:complete
MPVKAYKKKKKHKIKKRKLTTQQALHGSTSLSGILSIKKKKKPSKTARSRVKIKPRKK